MNNTTKLIVGMAVAAAAGAAIGMLLAPEKGTDLQKKIREGTKNFLGEFTSLIEMGRGIASEVEHAADPKEIQPTGKDNDLGV